MVAVYRANVVARFIEPRSTSPRSAGRPSTSVKSTVNRSRVAWVVAAWASSVSASVRNAFAAASVLARWATIAAELFGVLAR